jgi:DNA polymerase-4
MDLPINHNAPTIMHIDMNASFARAEQQAHPLLRNKPVGVAAYTGPGGCVVSPSVEAKQKGIKTAVNVREARMLAPDIIIIPPDPNLYREVHRRFCKIYRDYSPDVTPKSIDEAVIDFAGTPILKVKSMEEIALDIKRRIKEEIGCWMSCNIGIASNRFLAKLAASLHKPDGLDTITYENLLDVYAQSQLTDLNGINTRYQARLNAAGIYTPMEFFQADCQYLTKQVFKSVNGYHWFLRLRGWETDSVIFGRKSFGNSYALQKQTCKKEELAPLMMKLCEKTGRRLRRHNFVAYGVYVAVLYADGTHWGHGKKFSSSIYTSEEINTKAWLLLNRQPEWKKVRNLAVSVFDLSAASREQLPLFESEQTKRRQLSDAADEINDKYGEFIITPALMMGMEGTILDRISYGNVLEVVTEAYE